MTQFMNDSVSEKLCLKAPQNLHRRQTPKTLMCDFYHVKANQICSERKNYSRDMDNYYRAAEPLRFPRRGKLGILINFWVCVCSLCKRKSKCGENCQTCEGKKT